MMIFKPFLTSIFGLVAEGSTFDIWSGIVLGMRSVHCSTDHLNDCQ